MKPEKWGRYAWTFLHAVTIEYPENPTKTDKLNYYNYFNSLPKVLPCDNCKINLDKHMASLPLTDNNLSCRANLIKWGIDLHNIVNKDTGKPQVSYNDALEQFKNLGDEPKPNIWPYIIIILLIIVVLSVIFYFCFYQNYSYKKLELKNAVAFFLHLFPKHSRKQIFQKKLALKL